MKKTIKKPDGTIEEFEGTAEELAQIEKAISSKSPKKESKQPSRRILNEEIARLTKELEEAKKQILGAQTIRDLMKKIQEQQPAIPWTPIQSVPFGEPWIIRQPSYPDKFYPYTWCSSDGSRSS